MTTPSPFAAAAAGQAPEVSVSRDIVKRGLWVTPVFLVACGVIWGLHGAYSSAYALSLVLANFIVAASLIAVTAPISLALFWEMKYIAASLAFPGLRPNRQECPPTSAAEKH
ncbi:MAG: hypothetical protein EBS32_06290 [Actinobacteria bacterium]|nr:hypothetical protein [Actinomycetota bacterium]